MAPWWNYELACKAFLGLDPRILGYQLASFPRTGRHYSVFSKSQGSTKTKASLLENLDACQFPLPQSLVVSEESSDTFTQGSTTSAQLDKVGVYLRIQV